MNIRQPLYKIGEKVNVKDIGWGVIEDMEVHGHKCSECDYFEYTYGVNIKGTVEEVDEEDIIMQLQAKAQPQGLKSVSKRGQINELLDQLNVIKGFSVPFYNTFKDDIDAEVAQIKAQLTVLTKVGE